MTKFNITLFSLMITFSVLSFFKYTDALGAQKALQDSMVDEDQTDTKESKVFQKKKKSRSKSIDFDEEFVEGVNKRPLDSLNELSESNQGKKSFYIYDKTNDFLTENADSLRSLRYLK